MSNTICKSWLHYPRPRMLRWAPGAADFPHMSQAFDMLDILVPVAAGKSDMLMPGVAE
jgi:hypothetical protein